jgi:TPR repeat protein
MDGDNGRSPMVVIPVPPPPPPPPEPKLLVPISHGGHSRKGHGGDGHAADGGPPTALIAIVVAAVLLLFIGGCVLGFGLLPGPMGAWGGWWRAHPAVLACPRPPTPSEGAPQFNAQQREIRQLRREAFRGDFFAQLELARRYEGKRDSDKNLQDPVEAATWYALALANPSGYGRTYSRFGDAPGAGRAQSLYDDCREGERQIAYQALDRLLAEMSTDERDKVRNRATYVLSTQGAVGFTTLGRLHDVAFGPFGEPADNSQAVSARRVGGGWPDAVRLFERNGVDAYMYDYLAMQEGDEGAYVLLQDLKRSIPWPGFSDIAEQRARRWVPPYEFYPSEAPESGVPHSDESEPLGETDRIAINRINELPFRHLAEALAYLHVIAKPCGAEAELSPHDVQTFQAMLGHPTTGWLTSLEKVRAIQFAAVNGSPHAQLVLAVMYAEGIGVAPDYARAFHWFEEADRQGSPEAKFAVATYFSEGLAGVADQQKAEAVVHQLDAALSGFRPSIDRLSAMLDRVGGGHPGWYGYARPEEDGYSARGDRAGAAGPPPQGPPQGPPMGGAGPGGYGPPAGPGYADASGPAFGAGGEDWSRAAGDTRVSRNHRSAKAAPPHRAQARGRGHPSVALAKAGRSMTVQSPVYERSPAATPQTQGGSR